MSGVKRGKNRSMGRCMGKTRHLAYKEMKHKDFYRYYNINSQDEQLILVSKDIHLNPVAFLVIKEKELEEIKHLVIENSREQPSVIFPVCKVYFKMDFRSSLSTLSAKNIFIKDW